MKRPHFGSHGGENLPAKFEIVDVPGRPGPAPAGNYGYPQEIMDEPDDGGLVEYWRLLRRRKGTLILFAVMGLVAAVLITLPQTPIYQARTTLEVLSLNQNFMNLKDSQIVADSSGWELLSDMQTQIRILQSASMVEKVVKGFGEGKKPVADAPGLDGGTRVSAWRRALNLPEEKAVDARAEAIGMAAGTLKARATGQTRIIEMTVDSPDPKIAAEFANRLAQEYIEQNVEARWQMTQKAGDFLAKQLDDMRIKLERSEEALQEYAKRVGLVFVEGNRDEKGSKTNINEEKLSQLQTQLMGVQAERVMKQSRWETASQASADSLPDVLEDKGLQEYQTKLAELRRQKAELEETYTPDNARVKRVLAQIRSVEQSLERQRADILKRIKNDYEETARREKMLQASYDSQTGVVTDQGKKTVQYNILRREAETNRQMYETMLQRMKEASIASAMRASNLRVIDAAKIPTAPYKPSVPRNGLVGLIAGLVLGVGFIVTTDRANRTLQDPADLAYYLGVPELGMIPSQEALNKHKKGLFGRGDAKMLPAPDEAERRHELELVTYKRKPSLMAESFRAALTSILFSNASGVKPKSLVVTSPSPGEGKTTVASNLAIAMAETGHRVLLIDADMRKPRVHSIFEVDNEAGLTTLLRGEVSGKNPLSSFAGVAPKGVQTGSVEGEGKNPLSSFAGGDEGGKQPVAHAAASAEALAAKPGLGGDGNGHGVLQETEVANLFVLTSGPNVAGPTNLLYSRRMQDYLARFSEEFDMIFIDTPPMLQIPDARVIGKMADGVVLVVRAGQTTRDAAVASRARLREDGIRVIGTVMNDWNPKASPGGYYGYYDGYHKYYRKYHGYGYGYGQRD